VRCRELGGTGALRASFAQALLSRRGGAHCGGVRRNSSLSLPPCDEGLVRGLPDESLLVAVAGWRRGEGLGAAREHGRERGEREWPKTELLLSACPWVFLCGLLAGRGARGCVRTLECVPMLPPCSPYHPLSVAVPTAAVVARRTFSRLCAALCPSERRGSGSWPS